MKTGLEIQPSTLVTESRIESLIRSGNATAIFLQGIFPFVGHGIHEPLSLNESLRYTVPKGTICEALYFRCGNFSDDLLYLTLNADGVPTRYVPVSPKGDADIAMLALDAYHPDTLIEICIAAPRSLAGSVVVDVGLVAIQADEFVHRK